MKTKKVLVLLAICTLLLSCNRGDTGNKKDGHKRDLKGTISISGAFALYPITVKWAEEFKKINPQVRIDISAGGAGKGMTDALSGMVDLGMFSRGISDAEKQKGCWWISVTKDAVLPTINSNNKYLDKIKKSGISQQEFMGLYIDETISTWAGLIGKGPEKINIYTRSDACGAAQMWGEYLLKDQESLLGIGVFGDPGMADAVKKDDLGLGYNNVIYVFDSKTRKPFTGLDVVPIDLNNNNVIDPEEDFYQDLDHVMAAIKTGKYPSPPARELYLVANGKPEKRATVEFIKWILTEGQKYVEEAGYVGLTDDRIKEELNKLGK